MSSLADIRRAYPPGSRFSIKAMRDNWPVRWFDWPAEGGACGSILFQGGRGDIIEKYLEAFDHWHALRWNVSAFDWRGQGGSGRLSANPKVGHCENFGVWIDDLAEIASSWTASTPGPHVVVGHSMGGHLVLRALVEQRIAPDALVLVSPMLGFDTGPLPLRLVAWLVGRLARIWPERPAWRRNERPTHPWASRQTFLTGDRERYADELWWKAKMPELELGPPSLKWLEQAYGSALALDNSPAIAGIMVPTLILGTWGDRLVSPAAIVRVAGRIPRAKLKMFDKGVAHEILRERNGPRNEALALIDAHLLAVKAAS